MAEILYFTASWCGPCRSLRPIVAALKEEGVKITTIDVEQERVIADKWGVRAMPTMIFLGDDGATVNRTVGAMSKESILAELWKAENG